MKKVLFTAMILTVFVFGCAAKTSVIKPTIAAKLEKGGLENCDDCVRVGCASDISKKFIGLVRMELYKYLEEYDGKKIQWHWCTNTIYSNDRWYSYVTWESSFSETEELIVSLNWMAELVNKSQLDDCNISVNCLSKLRPVAKVIARAIIEELTLDEVWDELGVAIDTGNLELKKK